MTDLSFIKSIYQSNKYKSRSCRYLVVSEAIDREFGVLIEPHIIQKIESYCRNARDKEIFEADSIGESLEENYHATPQIHKFNNEQSLFEKRIITNI